MKPLLIALMLILPATTAIPQDRRAFADAEDSLRLLARDILYGSDDFHKYAACEQFLVSLHEVLLLEGSFEYPFDSLVSVSRLVSPDQRFRIFSWNLPRSDGTYEYFGIIQSWNNIGKKYRIYVLNDRTREISQPAVALLNNENWYGALYYKIIHHSHQGKDYYTLLGWAGNNTLTTRKLIEVLTFRSNGSPVFGYYLFRKYPQKTRRIIFEYSAQASMALRYDKQKLNPSESQQGKGKGIFGERAEEMIVFDRLVPINPGMEGQLQFYVPATNIFDGFLLEDGKWLFINDVDARNRDKSRDRSVRDPK